MTIEKLDNSELVVALLDAIALIFCFFMFIGASAKSISGSKYEAFDNNIMTEYKAAKIRCESLVANEKTFCDMNAKIVKVNSQADLNSLKAR